MKKITFDKKCSFGPCMDIKSHNGFLYAIQNNDQHIGGRLCKLNSYGELTDEFDGIGNARQIEINNGIAVISAREDGLWIIDTDTLELLCHYQTVEYATGVTLYANLAFISCRQYGVEIIDIKDSKHPIHIGLIRIGEVQSACVWNGYLFGGVWGGMNVSVVDIRDISSPELVTRIELQGRGDGVTVKDGILYAAIGHHRRGIKDISDEADECFGNGNGFEAFDVRDINNIKKLHTEFTEKRYYPRFDTWKPYVCGDVLLVTNSTLGLYAYSANDYKQMFHFSPADIDGQRDAVTGAAVCNNKLFVSTGRGGLYCFENHCYDEPFSYKADEIIPAKPHPFICDSDRITRLIHSDSYQILDVCGCDGGLVISCGSAGFKVTDNNGKVKVEMLTDGFCCSVKCVGNYLFSAESSAGFSIYKFENGTVERISTLSYELPVLQLYVNKKCTSVFLGCGSTTLLAVDIKDPRSPQIMYKRDAEFGPIYGENFASTELDDGTMIMFWHRDGLVYYNPDKPDGIKDIFYKRHTFFMNFGPESGVDTDGENVYYNLDGGYVILPMSEDVYADDLPKYVPSAPIKGKFVISDNKLIACERAEGEITVTDIADVKSPKSIVKISTNASPGKPVAINGSIYIPAGHGGLLKLNI